MQHSLVDKLDEMSAEDVATASDKFFDNEGRPLTSSTSSVNAVHQQPQQQQHHQQQQQHPQHLDDQPSFTAPFSDEETDVNYVSKRQFSRTNKFGGGNQGSFKPKQRHFRSNFSSNPSNSNRSSGSSENKLIKANGLCWAHDKFQNEAQNCYEGCSRFSQHKGKKVFSGNATPGRRT